MLHNTGTAEATMMDYSLGQSNTSKKLKENSNKILRGANRKETKSNTLCSCVLHREDLFSLFSPHDIVAYLRLARN